jgi:streptomycin 6-kinase
MSFNPPVVYKLCGDCLRKTVTSANTGNESAVTALAAEAAAKLCAPPLERIPSLAL